MAIVGYWRLNGNSNDASGNGFNGTDQNIIYAQANGVLNGGASFNGSSSKITIGDIGVDKNADKTWSLLVKINTDYTGADKYNQVVNWIINKTTNSIGYWRLSNVNMFVCDRSRVNISSDYIPFNNPTAAHGFYHLVGTITGAGATLCFYADGKLVDTKTVNTGDGAVDAGKVLYLGVGNGSVLWTNVCIDELKNSNICWSPAQVKNEYSRIKGFF